MTQAPMPDHRQPQLPGSPHVPLGTIPWALHAQDRPTHCGDHWCARLGMWQCSKVGDGPANQPPASSLARSGTFGCDVRVGSQDRSTCQHL